MKRFFTAMALFLIGCGGEDNEPGKTVYVYVGGSNSGGNSGSGGVFEDSGNIDSVNSGGSSGTVNDDSGLPDTQETSFGGSGGSSGNGGNGGTTLDANSEPDAPECPNNSLPGSVECPAKTCAYIKSKDPAAQSGGYYLQTGDAVPVIQVYCEMSFENAGWTLIYSSYNDPCPQQGAPFNTNAAFMPSIYVQMIANNSTKVHIRIANNPDLRSITSKENTKPITYIRELGFIGANYNSMHWYGSGNNAKTLSSGDGPTGTYSYPDIWFAENNQQGVIITTNGNGGNCNSTWNLAVDPGSNIEVYLGGMAK